MYFTILDICFILDTGEGGKGEIKSIYKFRSLLLLQCRNGVAMGGRTGI